MDPRAFLRQLDPSYRLTRVTKPEDAFCLADFSSAQVSALEHMRAVVRRAFELAGASTKAPSFTERRELCLELAGVIDTLDAWLADGPEPTDPAELVAHQAAEAKRTA